MTKETLLKNTDVFLFDLDGTVYLGETLIGDVRNTLGCLRDMNKRIVYLTNNSSKTEDEYLKKLTRIGVYDGRDTVYTSAMAAAEYVAAHFSGKRVYLLATDAVKAEFSRTVPIVEDDPEIVILAYDTTLDFGKMKLFNEFLAKGAYYIATHPDAVCPAKGVFPPDVGSFIRLFECSSHRLPDVVCGKPHKIMGEALEGLLDAKNDEIAMVGDRLHTDIRFANNSGFTGVLVLSGETTKEMLQGSKDRPDIVLNSLNDVAAYL